jgi:hypothetical protein
MRRWLAVLIAAAFTNPAQLSYTANGTGAAKRTLASKLSDVVSVKDFGATGDGVTDDTAAVQAAITAAAGVGSSVLFPTGAYLTTATLTVPANSTLIGRAAKIKLSLDDASSSVIKLTSQASNITISGFELDGQKASVTTSTTGKMGIELRGNHNVVLRDIYAHDNKGDGLYLGLNLAGDPDNSNIYVENWRSDANYRNGITVTSCDACRFVALTGTATSGSAPQAGLDIEPNNDTDTVNNIEFVACKFTGNTGYGAQVILRDAPSATQRGIRFTNSVFNSNTGGGILINSGVQVAFVASDFSLNQGAAADGIVINKKSSDISIVDSMIRLNQVNGINLNVTATFTVSRVRVINTTILDNRQAGSGAGDGIVTSGTLAGLTVIGSDLSNYAGATQRFGIATSSGTTGVTMIGNTAVANASAQFTLSDDLTSRFSNGNNGIPNIPNGTRKVITYSASMTPDTGAGTEFYINATNGTAFTINAPTTNVVGQDLTIRIRNASGGALGAVTWNATYHMSAWTQPANGQSRFITFRWDPTSAIWMQVNPAGVDIPN